MPVKVTLTKRGAASGPPLLNHLVNQSVNLRVKLTQPLPGSRKRSLALTRRPNGCTRSSRLPTPVRRTVNSSEPAPPECAEPRATT